MSNNEFSYPGQPYEYDEPRATKNTDRELWRGPDEGNGSYYADSIHVTASGAIGINCGGFVIVKPLRDWFALAAPRAVFADVLKE